METAILVVLVIGVIGNSWMMYFYADRILIAIRETREYNQLEVRAATTEIYDAVCDIRSVLTKASQIKAAKQPESIFDRDTLQPTGSRRYVPITVRRAQAEAQSMGPQTHDAKVRENNARAIESAG